MNRVCPYCAEAIKPAAKACPHCRQWLSASSLRNPMVAAVMVSGFMVVMVLGLVSSMNRIMNPGSDFSPHRDSISVVESHMAFHSDKYGPEIYVVGVLTNRSELAWKHPQLDLRFYNKSGALIDAAPAGVDGVIYPNGDLAFRARNRPCHDLAEYDSCQVFVRRAYDPQVRFY